MAGSAGAIRAGRAFVELFADDSKLQQGLKRAETRLNRFADEVRKVGVGLAAIGGTATAVFALAARQFAGFDDSMRTVGAVTGATAQQMAMLREEAQRLGRTTSFTAKQVADAMTELGRAGFAADEIMRSTDAVLALARATATELPQATQIAGAVLRGFAMDAEQMPRIADVLTATANMSAQTLSDLGEAMKVVAPLAVEAGESIEDVAAAIGILANNGIKGSLAGNALARAYKNLSTEAKQAELRDIGVQAVDASGNLRPLADILNDVADAVSQFGTARRLSIFESLFGRGQAAALKLAGDGKAVRELTEAIRAAGGVAEKTAEQMDAGLGGSFRKTMSAAEGVAIAVGDAIAGPLAKLADLITDVAGRVTVFVENNKGLVITIAAVGAGVLALGTALISVAAVAKVFTVALGAASLAAAALGAALTLLSAHPIIAALVVIAAGFVAVGAALQRLNRTASDHADELQRINEASEKARDADRDRLRRLDELSQKQELSNAEMREAANLIAILEGKYGDMGFVLDETARKLEAVAEAQKIANREMLKAQFTELFDEMDARRKAVEQLEQSIARREAVIAADPLRRDGSDGNSALNIARVAEERKQLEAELARLEEINRRIVELRTGGATADPEATGGAAIAIGAVDAVNDHAERWARRVHQLKLQQIEDELQREIALLNERYDHEIKLAEDNAAAIEQIEKARELELERIRNEHRQRRLAEEKRAAEEAARHRERIERLDQQQGRTVEELRLRATLEGAELEQALLDLREKQALEDATRNEQNLDLVREEFALRRELLAQQQEVAAAIDRFGAAGTFATRGIEQVIGTIVGLTGEFGDADERTANNTDEIAGLVTDIDQRLRTLVNRAGEGGLVFGP